MMATASPALAENDAPRSTSIRSPFGEGKLFRRSETFSPKSKVQGPMSALPPGLLKSSEASVPDFGPWTLDIGLVFVAIGLIRVAKHFRGSNARRRPRRINRGKDTQHKCHQRGQGQVAKIQMQRNVAD